MANRWIKAERSILDTLTLAYARKLWAEPNNPTVGTLVSHVSRKVINQYSE